jgi:hypothetical protein
METVIAAYLIALVAVVLYVARLGAQQRRICRTLESLQSHREAAGAESPGWSPEERARNKAFGLAPNCAEPPASKAA